MPQLRQLVIAAENPSRLSAFYQDVFELEKIDEAKEAVFLSDGVFNLALVTEPDARKQGLRHLGFDTVRVESMGKKLASAGVAESSLVQVDTVTGVEFELRDPDGNTVGVCRRAFDVAYLFWRQTQSLVARHATRLWERFLRPQPLLRERLGQIFKLDLRDSPAVARPGIEPGTPRFSVVCSTN